MAQYDPFDEYLKQSEPGKRNKGYAWNTAIGLQKVDGLKPSKYLIDTAIRNIEGEISIDEAQVLLDNYYASPQKTGIDDRTEEADKVSVRIAKILSEDAFSFTPNEYIAIHKELFNGIYEFAGKIRDYNITKSEWVLDGETVIYGRASELRNTLEYDLSLEKSFSYKDLSISDAIHHLAQFVSGLWQIHIFGEGNTRTTAVFFIKYLRTLGFNVTNDIFADNAWYFRNALVRANYTNLAKGVHETTEYLEKFLRNLLLGENNLLSNRSMHISGIFAEKSDIDGELNDVNTKKSDIDTKMFDIGYEKADIDSETNAGKTHMDKSLPNINGKCSNVTMRHIQKLFDSYSTKVIFGRSMVEAITGLKPSRASELLRTMLDLGVTETVKGMGKGKYRFR